MAGIPVEAMLAPDDTRTVSYAPSATVFKYLREQPRPDRHAGLLALGDPVYERPDASSEPKPLPDHGLLVNVVVPGSNAATHGLKPGDVLLAYNGIALNKKDDLKAVPEGDSRSPSRCGRPVVPARSGARQARRGARPPAGAGSDRRESQAINKVLVAARSGDEDFAPLPGTRYEVEVLARLFESDHRPTRILLGADASEPELDRLAASGELGRFGFIHLATHGVIDEGVPARSAVILTQTGLPDPLQQALNHQPVFDGRLLGPRDPARLGPEGRAGDALGVRDGPGPRCRRRGVRGVHPGAADVGRAERLPVALEGGRHGDGPLDAAVLRQSAGSPPRARRPDAQGRGAPRGEGVAARAASRGGAGGDRGAVGRRRAVQKWQGTPAVRGCRRDPAGGDNDRPYASPHF